LRVLIHPSAYHALGRIDALLRAEHDLPLPYFEMLWFLAHTPGDCLLVVALAEPPARHAMTCRFI